ncbi:restriction endonuclease [Patescibacteria group bacterium]|nr:restriction endonuclease [Patescibacteria group bacterium]MBU4458701.1 restriction endonuclease [Patescibacteria group bacterium]
MGFSNQANVKNFFGAKDITPTVDFNYIDLLNKRLYEIVDRLNKVVVDEIKIDNLKSFKKQNIDRVFNILKKGNILPKLNNQRRRPEQVYFSWIQGYIISNYFSKAISIIFGVDVSAISSIGEDDLRNIKTFKRTAKADLEITLNKEEKVIIEMQSGFTGTNDIKQHKVIEAKKVFNDSGKHTLAIHFDLYNGQVAFIKLDEIEDDSVNWITRPQMEGQMVFNIDQNHFVWKITEPPIEYKDMKFD